MTPTAPDVELTPGAVDVPPLFRRGPVFQVQAAHFGPTWEENPDWDGTDVWERYLLPELTLGYQALAWAREYLLSPDSTPDNPKPYLPTAEQFRFILWWYAVDENGNFIYRKGILQRLKGWGKDPIVSVLAAIEFLGPCRFAGWSTGDRPELGSRPNGENAVRRGDPIAKENATAWVQVAAVSKTQTKNTMLLFPALFTEKLKKKAGIGKNQMGINIITAYNNTRRIESVTSNYRTLEGGRATFVIKNETHHWISTNNGHEMSKVIDRNATKSKGGNSRSLSVTNAYEPSEDSVAQREREGWEMQEAGLAFKTGTLYDSLEAPKGVGLRPPRKPDEPEPDEETVRAWLRAVIISVRGDSFWLNIRSITDAILNVNENTPASSRRFYLNQVVADEDASFDPAAISAAIDPIARSERELASIEGRDIQRCGWIVSPDDPIVAFFDGSKSDDSTAIVACRVSDGYCFTIGTWNRPMQKERAKSWLAPRQEVDDRVHEMFRRFRVVAFFCDPSHTKDDSGNRYWDSLIDAWHRQYSDQLLVWSIKTGHNQHSTMWDMTSVERQRQFIAAVEMTTSELERKDAYDNYVPEFTHDGDPILMTHLRNSRRAPTDMGVSMRKEGRESLKKIDAGVCLVGARMLRRMVLNAGVEEPSGEVPSVGYAYSV